MSTFLDYLALVILIAGLMHVFYGFIYIHDLPYQIAKKRHHPHAEAIHVATWLSLFTLHAIWPLVYIRSVKHEKPGEGKATNVEPISAMGHSSDVGVRLARVEQRLKMVGILEPTGWSTVAGPLGQQCDRRQREHASPWSAGEHPALGDHSLDR